MTQPPHLSALAMSHGECEENAQFSINRIRRGAVSRDLVGLCTWQTLLVRFHCGSRRVAASWSESVVVRIHAESFSRLCGMAVEMSTRCKRFQAEREEARQNGAPKMQMASLWWSWRMVEWLFDDYNLTICSLSVLGIWEVDER